MNIILCPHDTIRPMEQSDTTGMPSITQSATEHLVKSVSGLIQHLTGQLGGHVFSFAICFEQGKGHIPRLERLLRQVARIMPAPSISIMFIPIITEYICMTSAMNTINLPSAALAIDKVKYLPLCARQGVVANEKWCCG